MVDYKERQSGLREDITAGVKRYCGYAEDVHDDYIIVNPSSLEVCYQSHNNPSHKVGYNYYPLHNLVTMENLCFVPDTQGIEAVIQDLVPSPEVKVFMDKAISRISLFLQSFVPASLDGCKLSVGHIFQNFTCFDESNPDICSSDPDSPEEEDIESYAIYPLKRFVVKGDSSYTIKSYPLAQLAVEILSL